MWLIQNVDSFLYGGVLRKGDTNDSSVLWDKILLLRVFHVRMRLLHYFPAVQWHGWWARAPGRAAGQENTGCGNGDGPSWWMPCHLCTAPNDTCSILVPRHLLIGQDEISRHCGVVYVHACEWVKGSVRYRLKERKVTGRKSEPRKREEKWIKAETSFPLPIWTSLYACTKPDHKGSNLHEVCIWKLKLEFVSIAYTESLQWIP